MSLMHRIKPLGPPTDEQKRLAETAEQRHREVVERALKRPEVREALTQHPRKPKVLFTLRLEPDVLEAWRSTGPGYQSRIADLLKRHAPLPLKGASRPKGSSRLPRQ